MTNELINKLFGDRRPWPLLIYPGISLLKITLSELLSSPLNQALAMKTIADKCSFNAVIGVIDATIEAEAFGAKVSFFEDRLPYVSGRVRPEEIKGLRARALGAGREEIILKAAGKAKAIIDERAVIAGVSGPLTVARELLGEAEITILGHERPEVLNKLIEKITLYLKEYVRAIKESGADGIFINEPAAGEVDADLCERFSSRPLRELVAGCMDPGFLVIYHNCGNVLLAAESIAGIGVDIYHFGPGVDVREMLKAMPPGKIVMGNVDPDAFAKEDATAIIHATRDLLSRCVGYDNFILSSGRALPPETPWKNIDAFFRAAEVYGR